MYTEAKAATLADRKRGLLTRLRTDTGGNVIAMTAAAMFPLLGLVGGAIDMGRLYAVKSRLQAACDAGALGGRRVMGAGQWADNGGRANTIARSTFDLNFAPGTFGSQNIVKGFTESGGTVTGTASADVPMTLMQYFGMPLKTLNVTCDGQMRIPNTDVMFVVDNSGSMNDVIPGDATGQKKINGLKIAVKCFYEALAKINIDDVTPAQCGTTSDPSGGLSNQVQLRFGFVPYDHMVNVGKLLPNDDMVDSATYQSRQANMQWVKGWSIGSPTAVDWDDWVGDPGASFRTTAGYGTFSTVSGSDTQLYAMRDGYSVVKRLTTATNAVDCTNANIYPGSAKTMVGIQENNAAGGTITYSAVDNNPPTYPAATQNQTASQSRTQTVSKGFRYRWFTNGVAACWLESANKTSSSNAAKYSQTRQGTASKPIIWTDYETIASWTYKPVTFDVSDLKAGGSTWNTSLSFPLNASNGPVVTLSGQSTTTQIRYVANATVAWDGCIEERQTFQNTDGNPADDWNLYPVSPNTAFDMDIDRVPDTSDAATQWRPALHAAVWGRQATLDASNNWQNGWSVANVTSPDGRTNSNRNLSNNSCVTEAAKMQTYNGTSGAQDFRDYVNTLAPHGNTYHDIGLLWGARLMSPTGIFASENATTPLGAQITRHMIFMTDGDTANTQNNYTSYGIDWWDRRQFNIGATAAQLEANNNARANTLCAAIKNKNITLWVVSYGDGVNATTINRLRACASGTAFFFSAADTTQLVTKFRQIAEQIADLRLTA